VKRASKCFHRMRTVICLFVTVVSVLARDSNNTKRSCTGSCVDVNSYVCSNGFKTGLCAGASNIKCCTGALCHGQCVDTNTYACSTGFQTGLCAGASNIKCCSGTLSCGGTCADSTTHSCSSGFLTGLCPGDASNQCCLGTVTSRSCSDQGGSCADNTAYTCSSGFLTGLCPGADSNQCCTGTLTAKSCSDRGGSCADNTAYTCSTGFLAGLCPGGSSNQCCTGTLTPSGSSTYNRAGAIAYANAHWNSPNHDCSTSYDSCSPYSYWGTEHCGYPSHGGDCANFVSQCLLAGGHSPLNGGAPCRGYPCGTEEIGANNLADCLSQVKGWTSTCSYQQSPPSNIQVGDVIVYHASSCSDSEAHATIITSIVSGVPYISCHSSERHNTVYTYMSSEMPYYEFLHISA
jgi:hypothetical protein